MAWNFPKSRFVIFWNHDLETLPSQAPWTSQITASQTSPKPWLPTLLLSSLLTFPNTLFLFSLAADSRGASSGLLEVLPVLRGFTGELISCVFNGIGWCLPSLGVNSSILQLGLQCRPPIFWKSGEIPCLVYFVGVFVLTVWYGQIQDPYKLPFMGTHSATGPQWYCCCWR